MNKFLCIIISIYIIISPFYIFPSGLPQPADIIIAVGLIVFMFHKGFSQTIKKPYFKYVKALLFVIITVNTCQSIYLFMFQNIENTIYFNSIFYLFNFSFMIIFYYVLKGFPESSNIIAWSILVSLLIQGSLGVLDISINHHEIGSRSALFFNNPNQLGYYALLMLTCFVILPSKIRVKRIILVCVMLLSIYLVLYSGSRAALGGVLVLSTFIMFREFIKFTISSVIVVVLAISSIPLVYNLDYVQKNLETIQERNSRDKLNQVPEYKMRGYDRILLNPEYLFFGAGEGKNDRFNSYHQLEIHSAFGTMLFSYGLIGLLLFLCIIYNSVKRNITVGLFTLSPIFIYNISHNGLRAPLFWICLIAAHLLIQKRQIQKTNHDTLDYKRNKFDQTQKL